MESAPPPAELGALLLAFATPPKRRDPRRIETAGDRGALESGSVELLLMPRLSDRAQTRETLRTARRVLARRGRVALALPPEALGWIFLELAAIGLVAKRAQMVHADRSSPAIAIFVEAQAGKPDGLVVEPPLVAAVTNLGGVDGIRTHV